MIKAKQTFFFTSNLEDYSFHGNKATILCLASKYYLLAVLPAKCYFFILIKWIKNYENSEFKFSRHIKVQQGDFQE